MLAAAAPKAAKRWLPEWISTDVFKVYFFAQLRRIIATRERRNPRRPARIYSRARVPSWPFWKALRRGSRRSRAGPALPSVISMQPCGQGKQMLSGSRTMASFRTIQSCPSCSIGAPSGFRANSTRRLCSKSFSRNGWGDSWRNGIYDSAHYHSRFHEVALRAGRPESGLAARRDAH